MNHIKNLAKLITEDPDINAYLYAIIRNPKGQILLQNHKDGWQFPGVEMVYGEGIESAVCRCSNEIGMPIKPVREMPLNYADSNYVMCKSPDQEPEHEDVMWISPEDTQDNESIDIQSQVAQLISRLLR